MVQSGRRAHRMRRLHRERGIGDAQLQQQREDPEQDYPTKSRRYCGRMPEFRRSLSRRRVLTAAAEPCVVHKPPIRGRFRNETGALFQISQEYDQSGANRSH